MYTEAFSVLAILLVATLVLLVLNAVVAGLLALLCRLAFWRCFRWGLLSLILPPVLLLYGVLVERNCYRVRTVEIASETLPAAFDGYRIVLFSDAHVGTMHGSRQWLLQRAEGHCIQIQCAVFSHKECHVRGEAQFHDLAEMAHHR